MTGGVDAGFFRRLAALLYDAFLLAAMLMAYTAMAMVFTRRAILPENFGGWVCLYRAGLLAVIGAYYIVNWTRSGQTLGMRAWHLRTVSASGQPLSFRAALLRFLCGIVAWPPAALGVLWLYIDHDHLALHDRLSRTRVVRLRAPN